MARAEQPQYNALVFKDKKLQEAGLKEGRLTPELRAAYTTKVKELEEALDIFNRSVANYNRTNAILTFELLGAFVLIMFFHPWAKHFENHKDITYDEYAKPEEEPTDTLKETATSVEL